MPAWLERDVDLGIAVRRRFEAREQRIDADRVPIRDRRGLSHRIPRTKRPTLAHFDQLPAARSRATTTDSQYESVVARFGAFPEIALPSYGRAQQLTLRGRLQREGSSARTQGRGGSSVSEVKLDTVSRNFARRVSNDMTNVSILLRRRSSVTR